MKVLVVLCALIACAASQTASGNVTIMGDITVTGSLRTSNLRSQSLTVDGSISVTHGVSAEKLTTNKADVTVLETSSISSPTGVVHISGQVATGSVNTNELHASSFIQNDVKQWAIVHHEDFEEEVKGWSTDKTSSCDGVDHHLAGHCNHVQDGQVSKAYNDLGEHTHVRVQARYHFLDSWEGESAFMKIGDKVVWTDTNDLRGVDPSMKSVCGGEHPDARLSVPIDVTIRHSGPALNLAFGSTLDEHPCNESFGIDDVVISVR